MLYGQGNVGFIPKAIPSGAPFAPNSADNGLSVDPVSGRIVLGNDVGGTGAQLLSDREIVSGGFYLYMLSGFGDYMKINDFELVIDSPSGGFFTGITGGSVGVSAGPTNESAVTLIATNPVGADIVISTNGTLSGEGATITMSRNFNATWKIEDDVGIDTWRFYRQSAGGISMQFDDNNARIDFDNNASNLGLSINGNLGFTGTVSPVTSITVDGGIVTAVS